MRSHSAGVWTPHVGDVGHSRAPATCGEQRRVLQVGTFQSGGPLQQPCPSLVPLLPLASSCSVAPPCSAWPSPVGSVLGCKQSTAFHCPLPRGDRGSNLGWCSHGAPGSAPSQPLSSRLKQRLFCNSFLPPGALLAARPSQPTVQVSKYCILPPPPLISHTSSEKETPLHTQHVHVCIAVPFQSVPPAELQSCCCRCEGITFTVDKITSFEQLGSQQQQNRGWGSKDHFWCHWKSNTAVVSQHKEQLV